MPKLRICFISPEKKSQFTVRPWVLAEMVGPRLVLFRSLLGSAFVGRTLRGVERGCRADVGWRFADLRVR